MMMMIHDEHTHTHTRTRKSHQILGKIDKNKMKFSSSKKEKAEKIQANDSENTETHRQYANSRVSLEKMKKKKRFSNSQILKKNKKQKQKHILGS